VASSARSVTGRAFSQAWGSYRSHQEEERSSHRPPARRYDEPPTGYSSAGCSPAEPASASPAGCHSETMCRVLSIGAENPLDTASRFQRWLPARIPIVKGSVVTDARVVRERYARLRPLENSNYPPAKPEALRWLAPQRGRSATVGKRPLIRPRPSATFSPREKERDSLPSPVGRGWRPCAAG
jgi:hypothetical protein